MTRASAGANTVAGAIERHRPTVPGQGTIGDAKIDVLTNSADAVEANYATVRSTLIEGTLLGVAIVFVERP